MRLKALQKLEASIDATTAWDAEMVGKVDKALSAFGGVYANGGVFLGARGAAAGVVLAAAENDAGDRVPGVAHHLDAPALQHFVSVAFRSRDLAARLRARPAMLYFVFTQETTSVVVAHNLHEGLFNLQFPVFPPAERPGDAAAPRNVRRAGGRRAAVRRAYSRAP